jgi:hypothetical protein
MLQVLGVTEARDEVEVVSFDLFERFLEFRILSILGARSVCREDKSCVVVCRRVSSCVVVCRRVSSCVVVCRRVSFRSF